MASPREIKRWLLQLKMKPRLLMLGAASEAVLELLKQLGVEYSSIRNPLVELAEIWRRVSICQAIVLLPDFDDEHRMRVQDSFGHVPITSIEETGKEEEGILSVLEHMIVTADPRSDRKPKEKDHRTKGHHTPRRYPRYNDLCESICELPQVTSIRYFKYAGRDLEVVTWPEDPEDNDSKTDLRVRTTERCGVVVSVICDHPTHLETIKSALEALLTSHDT